MFKIGDKVRITKAETHSYVLPLPDSYIGLIGTITDAIQYPVGGMDYRVTFEKKTPRWVYAQEIEKA